MSTGMASLTDLEEAVKVLRDSGCEDLILLKCTSTYPASPENTNLLTIPHMSQLFNCHVGLSDHTLGIGCALTSVALGARVIEKHFTLNRAEGGVDSAFSIEPNELKSLVSESGNAFLALGYIKYGIQEVEKSSLRFKRSVYIVRDVISGDILDENSVRIIRPGDGLKPKYYKTVIGKKAKKDIKAGTPLTWDLITS